MQQYFTLFFKPMGICGWFLVALEEGVRILINCFKLLLATC